ncbi:MAG: dienelactone hydrolase family protein [Acidimicrobiales bacterium]
MSSSSDISIPSAAGDIPALLFLPEAGTGPAVVLIQEIFGVNQYVRDVAERLAGEGYVVLAPHMYWRIEDDFAVEATGPDDLPVAFEVAGQHDPADGVADIGAALAHLADRPEVTGPVGVIGFCFGGSMTYLAAAAHDPACAVSYYGSMIGENIDKAASITCPIQFHFGSDDAFLPNDDVDALRAATADMANVEIHVAEGAGHAFDNHRNPMFSNPEAAASAWALTSAFLATNLAP